jgi:DNA-binding NarL/FixJ family response regulator
MRDPSGLTLIPNAVGGARIAAMGGGLLIVDDHAGYRGLARTMLERQGCTVVGEAFDRESALLAVHLLDPAVVLLDVNLPGDDGFAIAELLSVLPRPPVVLLISSRTIRDLKHRLAVSPAVGFVSKEKLSRAAIEECL